MHAMALRTTVSAKSAETGPQKTDVLKVSQQKPGGLVKFPAFNINSVPILTPTCMGLQAKLKVSAPGDQYEQEADLVSEEVMRAGKSRPITDKQAVPFIQRKCAECEKEEDDQLQRKQSDTATPPVSANVHHTLQSQGRPLDPGTRTFMENRFGYDFGKVKIHTDTQANQSARDIGAYAYTHRHNIVFAGGQYQPGTESGKKMIAHELTHVLQQNSSHSQVLQRQTVSHGGPTGAPADWSTQVSNADTSAKKATLIGTVVGSSVAVVDKTAASKADKSPDPAHLEPFTATKPVVNFDENLESKSARVGGRSLANNAGYTLFHNNQNYVILGAKSIDSKNYYDTLYTLNHELDHVRQNIAGSKLTGNASELDAWTSSFIREFPKSYTIEENQSTGNCHINKISLYVPLLGYYEASGVEATDKTAALQRIITFYTSVIKPHAGHLAAFHFWLRRSLDNDKHTLADDIISDQKLSITAAMKLKELRQFKCGNISSLSFPSPTLSVPTFPAKGATTPKTK
jgi:Zn-dependent peptidase ImmA (M78 family)